VSQHIAMKLKTPAGTIAKKTTNPDALDISPFPWSATETNARAAPNSTKPTRDTTSATDDAIAQRSHLFETLMRLAPCTQGIV
jgi:hypothetical protein